MEPETIRHQDYEIYGFGQRIPMHALNLEDVIDAVISAAASLIGIDAKIFSAAGERLARVTSYFRSDHDNGYHICYEVGNRPDLFINHGLGT